MSKKNLYILSIIFLCCTSHAGAQGTTKSRVKSTSSSNNDTIQSTSPSTTQTIVPQVIASANSEDVELPVISYNAAKKLEIAEIKISGVKNPMYEDFTLIGFSGLKVGDKIEIPGTEITNAIKRFWKQGFFSDIRILATKIQDSKVWLEISLKERPRISEITYVGVSKGEKKDLEAKIGMVKKLQITPNQLDKARNIIRKFYDEKGFNKAEINLTQVPDLSEENQVILNIEVKKKNKTKVNEIIFEGNNEVDAFTLEKAMKKTRHKSRFKSWVRNFLRSTKYVPEGYEEDKDFVIAKYNELGYRDAAIVWDTVMPAEAENKPDKINVVIKIDEGRKYYLRSVKWLGNTEYPSSSLQSLLDMKPGDVYDQKKLSKRLAEDEDAVMNYFYQNNGYLFSGADPVEVNIVNDSVDLEIRVMEGKQATIRKVTISGNDRVYEDVIRRELKLKPGALYSREDIIRTLREIAQMGHFDPENLNPGIVPDPEAGVVDVSLPLSPKASDQVEFSAGWGETGIIGRASVKFSNFSLSNLLNPKSYKGLIPQGEGQTLTLSAQTNARFYQSYSLSFFDPWFGGKRPNSLSVGVYYSKQTGMADRYMNNLNMIGLGGNVNTGSYADPDKYMQMVGASVGYGKRLTWPDDGFYAQAELSYQRYMLKNWRYYFPIFEGNCNSLSMNLSLSRRSTDSPIYTRRGSEFSASVEFTLPYSMWDGKDYAAMTKPDPNSYYESGEKHKWIEYHKWKFKAKTFIPLADVKRTPVLMARAEYGFVGYYNKHKQSPFGSFYVGGDGMSGSQSTNTSEIIGLRGYENGAISSDASSYTRLGMELRYPLILEPSSTIYILTFAEAGNAWKDFKKFNPFNLKRSAGVGARIHLPMIGLMGIDWAYGFDKVQKGNDYTRSGGQFHFVIGQEF